MVHLTSLIYIFYGVWTLVSFFVNGFLHYKSQRLHPFFQVIGVERGMGRGLGDVGRGMVREETQV